MSNEQMIWNALRGAGLNAYGAAGVMGNLYAESGLRPENLQDVFERSLGMMDYEYTQAVDAGTYDNFERDGAGYGLAQWTWWTRKRDLLAMARMRGVSIGDLRLQLDYLMIELRQYGLIEPLNRAASVRDASDLVLTQFERPADQSERMQIIRANYGQQFFDRFAKGDDNMDNYTNSAMAVCTILSPNNSGLRTHSIDRISPHCVVGQCSAEALGALFADKNRNASSNYGIDKDGRVGMYVEEKTRSWCTSSSANDNRAITIECASDNFHPYRMNDAVFETLVQLCADICRRYGKNTLLWIPDKDTALGYEPKDNEMLITVHRWFANKSCPGDWLFARLGNLAERVTALLQNEEDENMTIDRFKELMREYRALLQDNDAGEWSRDARAWAVENGLIQGGGTTDGDPNYMWEDQLTREQMVVLLFRFAKMIGLA